MEKGSFGKKRRPVLLQPVSREHSKDRATNSLIPDIKKWIKKTAKKLKDCSKLLKEELKVQNECKTIEASGRDERSKERRTSEERKPRHKKKNLSMYCDQKSDLNVLKQVETDSNRNGKRQTFQFKKLKMNSIENFHTTAVGPEKHQAKEGKKVNIGKQSTMDLKAKDFTDKGSRTQAENKRSLLDCSKGQVGFKQVKPLTAKGEGQTRFFKTVQNEFKSERTKSKEEKKKGSGNRSKKLTAKPQVFAGKSDHEKCSIGKLKKHGPNIILQSKGSFHLNFNNISKNFLQKKSKQRLKGKSRSGSKSKSRSKSFRKDHVMCTTTGEEQQKNKEALKIRKRSKGLRTGKNSAKKPVRSLSKSSTDQEELDRRIKDRYDGAVENRSQEDSNLPLIGGSSCDRQSKQTNKLLQNIFQNIRLKEHSESSLELLPFEKSPEDQLRFEEDEEPVCMKPSSAERRELQMPRKDQGKKSSVKDSQQSSSLYELSRKSSFIEIITTLPRPFSGTKNDIPAISSRLPKKDRTLK
jgi:hypothetical protein